MGLGIKITEIIFGFGGIGFLLTEFGKG